MNNKPENLSNLFFKELKTYNSTNFRTLLKADLSREDASTIKAFSSVLTRFFIFLEKHKSEVTGSAKKVLYFQLKLDLIAKYFSEYPTAGTEHFRAFQIELQRFVKENRGGSGKGVK